jgi:hypothetical protein
MAATHEIRLIRKWIESRCSPQRRGSEGETWFSLSKFAARDAPPGSQQQYGDSARNQAKIFCQRPKRIGQQPCRACKFWIYEGPVPKILFARAHPEQFETGFFDEPSPG